MMIKKSYLNRKEIKDVMYHVMIHMRKKLLIKYIKCFIRSNLTSWSEKYSLRGLFDTSIGCIIDGWRPMVMRIFITNVAGRHFVVFFMTINNGYF